MCRLGVEHKTFHQRSINYANGSSKEGSDGAMSLARLGPQLGTVQFPFTKLGPGWVLTLSGPSFYFFLQTWAGSGFHSS